MIKVFVISLLLSFVFTPALAIEESSSNSVLTSVDESIEQEAERWSLTIDEWQRYEEIMRGEGRYNWRDVDPITVLGIYAKNNAERERYAERLAIQEYTLQKRFLALNTAYLKAFQRLYGDEPIISMDKLTEFYDTVPGHSAPAPLGGSIAAIGDRYVLFLSPGCHGCDDYYQKIKKLQSGGFAGLDIYFVGANDTEIMSWAATVSLDPQLVKNQVVTLNHDSGTYARYNRPPLPSAFYYNKTAEAVYPIEMEAGQ